MATKKSTPSSKADSKPRNTQSSQKKQLTPPDPKLKAKTSFRIPTTVLVAIIGCAGVVVAALIGSPLMAELLAPSTATPTSTPTPTFTFTPTSTFTPSPTSTFTPTPTMTLTPFICPYQGATDDETIHALIMAEAVAVRDKNMRIVNDIFSFDATFSDYATNPPKISVGVEARYANDLFIWVNFKDAKHFAILPAGAGISGNVATYTSGSDITYQVDGGPTKHQVNPSGSEHWFLEKNMDGCWVIVQMDFNAGHIKFPP